jgi:hypothetical protein
MAIDPIIQAVFGPTPDGTDLSESITKGYDVVACVVLGIAAASVALRFYVRMFHTATNLAIDDWTIVIGLVSDGDPVPLGILGMRGEEKRRRRTCL